MARALSKPLVQDARIRRTPGVCGGRACVRELRLPVWLLVQMRDDGMDEQAILADYSPRLTAADLAAAWAYERTHRTEIARDLAENEVE